MEIGKERYKKCIWEKGEKNEVAFVMQQHTLDETSMDDDVQPFRHSTCISMATFYIHSHKTKCLKTPRGSRMKCTVGYFHTNRIIQKYMHTHWLHKIFFQIPSKTCLHIQ
jgi:hypothetical protein